MIYLLVGLLVAGAVLLEPVLNWQQKFAFGLLGLGVASMGLMGVYFMGVGGADEHQPTH